MNSEILRRAADALEQVAEGATDGPWSFRHNYEDDNPEEWRDTDIRIHPSDPIFGGVPQIIGFAELCESDGEYIALVDPVVGKAIAEWLRWESLGDGSQPSSTFAFTIARAVLSDETRGECAHSDSMWGRCAACGMTWEQQAKAQGES